MEGDFFYVALSGVVGLFFTSLAMPFLLKYCRMKGFYDMPGGRKVHHEAVPRLGGILFMPAMLVGLAVALILYARDGHGVFTHYRCHRRFRGHEGQPQVHGAAGSGVGVAFLLVAYQ